MDGIVNHGMADVNQICNLEKTIPSEWITKEGSDISNDFVDYAAPLIQGTAVVPQKDGLPMFLYRKQ